MPVFTASDYYEDWTYTGGAFLLGTKLMWAGWDCLRGPSAPRGSG